MLLMQQVGAGGLKVPECITQHRDATTSEAASLSKTAAVNSFMWLCSSWLTVVFSGFSYLQHNSFFLLIHLL